jgi:hypothetical protein
MWTCSALGNLVTETGCWVVGDGSIRGNSIVGYQFDEVSSLPVLLQSDDNH